MNAPYAAFIENVFRLHPVFLVGSGSSAGAGISTMARLAAYLAEHVSADLLSLADAREWRRILRRLTAERRGLEEALQLSGEALSESLLQEIVRHTWRRISEDEQKQVLDISNGCDPTGFVRYFRNARNTNHFTIDMVTTNYDHLLEWSASASGWGVWDGFNEGAIGVPLSAAELDERMKNITRLGKRTITTRYPYVRLYKPHGSLSWFKYPDGQIRKVQGVGSHLLPQLAKVKITPAIVTPGTGKYLETHRDPYAGVLAQMRSALEGCRALVVVGFGFNDHHVQASFETLLRDESVPKVIAARNLSDSVKALIRERKIRHYFAFEKEGDGSRIVGDGGQTFSVRDPGLWTLKGLLAAAWGVEADAGTTGLV
ncbi:SIR2 family protein [Cohnella zeiphila]|uniref:SIR2 family protein n=1 Tax=Cohnella zeiphila TaxID=2761120 RepID=A0A7X0VX72_9BACL|nr:SIR2 family protein [Cohnella zeiphila]MBB6733974.1 SIR2 family protein [Cohnella zeiphila]